MKENKKKIEKVRIEGSLEGYGSHIWVDDREIKKVRAVDCHIGCDELTTVRIDLVIPPTIETEAEVEYYSNGETIENLILNRSTEELLKFGNKILRELDRRRNADNRFNHKNDKI